MNDQRDYRDSHTDAGKGQLYDERFDRWPWRRYLWQREREILTDVLTRRLQDGPITHLDFACGTGRILEFLRPFTSQSVGLDVSESMLGRCRAKAPDAEIINADITHTDVLGHRTFRLITAFRFFAHAQPELRTQAMEALSWHLADDGILVFNNHRNRSSTLLALGRCLGREVWGMSRGEVAELVASAGLAVDEVFAVGALPISDHRPMLFPPSVHATADRAVNLCGLGPILCQDCIYVCRRAHSPAQPDTGVARSLEGVVSA